MLYVEFDKGRQNTFLREVKLKLNLTWLGLADLLKVDRSMIYFYLNESSKLPFDFYTRLCKLCGIKVDGTLEKVNINNKFLEVKKPSLNEDFAEFLGALAGDGHVSANCYEVSISLDKDLDLEYSNRILFLFYSLFGLIARKYFHKNINKLKCYVYSKDLISFLSGKFRVPVGKKKGYLNIPDAIKSSDILLKAYIRGLFDTDGTFHRHRQNDAMLGIISRDYNFLKEVETSLLFLGFSPSVSGKNLYIYRKKHIDRFFNEVKPANSKHIKKYKYFKKYGKVPLTKRIRSKNAPVV